MCGITCILTTSDDRDAIVAMTDAIVHRGPDQDGYFRDDRVALGNRRLSINDLAGGRQPLSNETGDVHLVCNGEIYNSPELRRELIQRGHRFRTGTDIEVILHLYEERGADCVKALQGMFGFALWDQRAGRLLVARDPMGQKPIFFHRQGDRLIVASEIKSILASGLVRAEVDLEALWHYISLRYLPDEFTLFRGIGKLPAGSFLLVENGQTRIERYWQLEFSPKTKASEAEVLADLDARLRQTVESHLLSDVRVGVFLSGGIDSSLVAAITAELTAGKPVPAFSIGVREQGFNELPFARMVAKRYGLEHHERVVEADLVHLVPRMIDAMDEPVDPFGVGVYQVSKLAAEHVKVVLTGDGGDESFAGYDRYAGERMLDWYCLLPAMFRREIVGRLINRIPETFGYKSLAQKARWMNDMSLYPRDERYAHSMGMLRFTREAKQRLFTGEARGRIGDDDTVAKVQKFFNAPGVDEIVDRMLNTDLMTRMPDHLLFTVDRMSMAHSLEARAPLVDHKLVEFAASIPQSIKFKGNRLKYLLRRVSERYLPRELIYRPKQGFGFPLGIWMRTSLRGFVARLLAESRFVALGVFDRTYVDEIFRQHVEGRVDHSYRLWLLITLEFWYRQKIEGQSVAEMVAEIDRLGGGAMLSAEASPSAAA